MNINNFGEQIKKYRKQMGLNRPNFCVAADISFSQLNSIEHGQQIPTTRTAIKILNTLNLSFCDFLGNDLTNNKNTYRHIIESILLSLNQEDLDFIKEVSELYVDKKD